MKQIARLCGVSEGTVSKALCGKAGINDQTRERIASIAKQYHYRANALVRSIQSSRTMTVGVACNTFDYEFPGRVMNGIMGVMSANNYGVYVISWNTEPRGGAHVLRSMGERRVDGILMYPPGGIDPRTYLEEMRSFHAPLVLVDQTVAGADCDFVGNDDVRGGFELMDYLLNLGHRKVGIIGDQSSPRFAGFRDAMLRHGVALRSEWTSQFGGERDVYAAAKYMLTGEDRPTAIVCATDMNAVVVYSVAYDLGIRIPQELSVTGYADLVVSNEIRPQLTTVRQDAVAIGRQAAQLLFRRIQERQEDRTGAEGEPEKILLPTELVVRESTTPPNSKDSV